MIYSILFNQVKINEVPQMQGRKLRDEGVNNTHCITLGTSTHLGRIQEMI